MTLIATYVSKSGFSIDGERDHEFAPGRKLVLSQGINGTTEVGIVQAIYNSGTGKTLVQVQPELVRSTLVSVKRGATSTESTAIHGHTSWMDGGEIPASQFNAEAVNMLLTFVATMQIPVQIVAGEALVRYDVIYQDTSTGKWKKAQSDGTSQQAEVAALVADATIASNAVGSVIIMGFVTKSTWSWSPGHVLWLSATSGAMTQTRPTSGYAVRVGRAFTNTTVFFSPGEPQTA